MAEQRHHAPDLLYGVAAIASYLGMKRRQAQYQIEKGTLPHFRMDRVICARRSKLNEWVAACEAADADATKAP